MNRGRAIRKIILGVVLLLIGTQFLLLRNAPPDAFFSGSSDPGSAAWDSGDDGSWWDSGGWSFESSGDDSSWDWSSDDWDSGGWDSGGWDSGGWDSGSWDSGGTDSGSW